MPDGAWGTEPSPLERLVAAREAEKKAQRKKDTRVLASLASSSTAGAQCSTRDGYIHPDYPSGPPDTVQASGKPVNPYSLATPSAGAGCQNTTGT